VNPRGCRAALASTTNRYWAEAEMQLRSDPNAFYDFAGLPRLAAERHGAKTALVRP
jgi:hypothetical protein